MQESVSGPGVNTEASTSSRTGRESLTAQDTDEITELLKCL